MARTIQAVMATAMATAALACALSACSKPPVPARTAAELVDDPALLQGILLRCQEHPRAASRDTECINARKALETVAAAQDAQAAERRRAEFERQRALKREQDDRQRQSAEQASPKFDPYRSPVVADPPAESPPPAPGSAAAPDHG